MEQQDREEGWSRGMEQKDGAVKVQQPPCRTGQGEEGMGRGGTVEQSLSPPGFTSL